MVANITTTLFIRTHSDPDAHLPHFCNTSFSMHISVGCTWYIIASNKLSAPIELRQYYYHCMKYARIQVFTDPYSPVYCLYTGEYGSVKARILAYFTLKSIDWFLYEANTGIGNTGIMLELIRNEKKRIN